MIRKKSVIFFVAIGALLNSVSYLAAQERNPAANDPSFAGKVVFLPNRGGLLLEHVQLKQLGNTPFIVGKLRGKSDPLDGKLMWIAVSAIESLVEFDSVEQAQKMLDQIKKNQQALPGPAGVAIERPVASPTVHKSSTSVKEAELTMRH